MAEASRSIRRAACRRNRHTMGEDGMGSSIPHKYLVSYGRRVDSSRPVREGVYKTREEEEIGVRGWVANMSFETQASTVTRQFLESLENQPVRCKQTCCAAVPLLEPATLSKRKICYMWPKACCFFTERAIHDCGGGKGDNHPQHTPWSWNVGSIDQMRGSELIVDENSVGRALDSKSNERKTSSCCAPRNVALNESATTRTKQCEPYFTTTSA